ncbi:PAS domain-containing protein [Adhaeribacter radiodurans]|uniref:histidine kinase n=1 Tax=Adhaeribacter radiodurans TaxID=2745197 RepID=A0A7L7L4J2_9BACT|nr:PAS domain S-box protein [Adhaeribacter radiodurans]QMU27728.1 PAS domain S-box protein [Adhaeribacter radiodurans]
MRNALNEVALAQVSTIIVIDSQGFILEANENFCQISQYTASELIGQPICTIQTEPQSELFLTDLASISGVSCRRDIKIKAKNNSYVWLDTTIVPLPDANSQVTSFLYNCFDITSKKEAEAKLIRQVQKYNFMVEHNPDGYVNVNAGWQITDCNKVMEGIIGLTREQSIGRDFIQIFVSGTDGADKCPNLERALYEQEPTSFEVFCPARKIWFEINVYPDGIGLALTFRDITQLKINIQKIKRSEQQLRAILQSTVSAFFFLGLDMRIISFNEEARQSIKRMYNKELHEGDDIRLYSFEKDTRAITESFQNALLGRPVEIERKTQIAGKTEWYWMTYFPVFDEDQRIIGVVLNAANINNLKLFETETLQTNERFRLAAKATKDAIYDWNIEQNTFKRYEAFYEMFGYQPQEVESSLSWWAQQIHPDDRVSVVNSLNQAILDKQKHWQAEYRFKCCNNSYKFVYDRGYIVYTETDTPTRMIGALQDIQQVKEIELKITQQNEQLREIAFSQSHEVRRPVANILGLLQCLNKDEFKSENQQVLLYMEQTTKELDQLIRKIVDKAYHT